MAAKSTLLLERTIDDTDIAPSDSALSSQRSFASSDSAASTDELGRRNTRQRHQHSLSIVTIQEREDISPANACTVNVRSDVSESYTPDFGTKTKTEDGTNSPTDSQDGPGLLAFEGRYTPPIVWMDWTDRPSKVVEKRRATLPKATVESDTLSLRISKDDQDNYDSPDHRPRHVHFESPSIGWGSSVGGYIPSPQSPVFIPLPEADEIKQLLAEGPLPSAQYFHQFYWTCMTLQNELVRLEFALRSVSSSGPAIQATIDTKRYLRKLRDLYGINSAVLFPEDTNLEVYTRRVSLENSNDNHAALFPLYFMNFGNALGALAKAIHDFNDVYLDTELFNLLYTIQVFFREDLASRTADQDGNLKRLKIRAQYLLSERLGQAISQLTEVIRGFHAIGIPIIKEVQQTKTQRYVDITTIATLLSGVTASMIQTTAEDEQTIVGVLANTLFFSSLVFGIGSAVNCMLVMSWRRSLVREPDGNLSFALKSWLHSGPMLALIISGTFLSLGLCLSVFSTSQNGATSVITIGFSGCYASMLVVLAVLHVRRKWNFRSKTGEIGRNLTEDSIILAFYEWAEGYRARSWEALRFFLYSTFENNDYEKGDPGTSIDRKSIQLSISQLLDDEEGSESSTGDWVALLNDEKFLLKAEYEYGSFSTFPQILSSPNYPLPTTPPSSPSIGVQDFSTDELASRSAAPSNDIPLSDQARLAKSGYNKHAQASSESDQLIITGLGDLSNQHYSSSTATIHGSTSSAEAEEHQWQILSHSSAEWPMDDYGVVMALGTHRGRSVENERARHRSPKFLTRAGRNYFPGTSVTSSIHFAAASRNSFSSSKDDTSSQEAHLFPLPDSRSSSEASESSRRRYDRHIFAWRRRVERVLYSGALVGNNLKDNKVSGLRRALSLPPKSNAWDLPDVKGPRRSQSAPPECIEDGIIATLRRRAEYSTDNPIIFSKLPLSPEPHVLPLPSMSPFPDGLRPAFAQESFPPGFMPVSLKPRDALSQSNTLSNSGWASIAFPSNYSPTPRRGQATYERHVQDAYPAFYPPNGFESRYSGPSFTWGYAPRPLAGGPDLPIEDPEWRAIGNAPSVVSAYSPYYAHIPNRTPAMGPSWTSPRPFTSSPYPVRSPAFRYNPLGDARHTPRMYPSGHGYDTPYGQLTNHNSPYGQPTANYGSPYAQPTIYGSPYAQPANYGSPYAQPTNYGSVSIPPVSSVQAAAYFLQNARPIRKNTKESYDPVDAYTTPTPSSKSENYAPSGASLSTPETSGSNSAPNSSQRRRWTIERFRKGSVQPSPTFTKTTKSAPSTPAATPFASPPIAVSATPTLTAGLFADKQLTESPQPFVSVKTGQIPRP